MLQLLEVAARHQTVTRRYVLLCVRDRKRSYTPLAMRSHGRKPYSDAPPECSSLVRPLLRRRGFRVHWSMTSTDGNQRFAGGYDVSAGELMRLRCATKQLRRRRKTVAQVALQAIYGVAGGEPAVDQ
jgi:hypothetical protein